LPSLRHRVVCLFATLIAGNCAVWLWAFSLFHAQSVLLGTALLAYGLGLRHAVDADHIAAIDNVTRRLMETGRRPVGVGLFFSLGHSSVVVAASIGVALTADGMRAWLGHWQGIGGVIGTVVSSGFLLTIAAINAVVLIDLVRRMRAGGDATPVVATGGVLSRLLRPVFRLITRSWQMYPLGLVFGLGFDTATEVALLGISAAEASHGLPIWSILVFPALFTAGMSLVDSADSVLMLGAYGWAFGAPTRRLGYNLAITSLSVLVAVLVGGLEIFGLLSDRLSWHGGFWRSVGAANADFGYIGLGVVCLFTLVWLASMAVSRRAQNQ
jgi:high-affinity nickel-transport protein